MTNQNEHERDATHALKRARAYPYADIQPTDAAAHAAQAIAYDLCDRRGIKYEMRQVDAEVRREIVLAHAAIIRAAIQAQASGQAAWAIITPELSALAWQRAIAQGDAAGHMHLRVARQVVELMGGQASGQAVPSGWKLVPVEPTDRMTWVGQSLRPDTEISIGSIYAAMLAAAPTPEPVAVGQQEGVHANPGLLKCPITGRPYFMTLKHPVLGMVETFGGPYDSYTVPVLEGAPTDAWHDREMRCERYDHDEGSWVEGGEPIPLRIINEDVLCELQAAVEAAAPALDQQAVRNAALEEAVCAVRLVGANPTTSPLEALRQAVEGIRTLKSTNGGAA